MIRLVVSDVDGTMMDETENIPYQISELKALIEEKGVLFTIASGREYSQIAELEELLEIKIPVIMCNGTAARNKSGYCWCETMNPEIAKYIIEKADQYGMTVILSMPDGEFAYRRTAFVEQTIKQFCRFGNTLSLKDKSWRELSIQKILIIDKDQHPEFKDLLLLLDTYKNDLTYVSFGTSIDIVPKGCNKASGIRKLAALLDINMNEIMAIGDGHNDIEMVRESGIGVAVNNAADELKACADYACSGKYIDGVMEAIRKFC